MKVFTLQIYCATKFFVLDEQYSLNSLCNDYIRGFLQTLASVLKNKCSWTDQIDRLTQIKCKYTFYTLFFYLQR